MNLKVILEKVANEELSYCFERLEEKCRKKGLLRKREDPEKEVWTPDTLKKYRQSKGVVAKDPVDHEPFEYKPYKEPYSIDGGYTEIFEMGVKGMKWGKNKKNDDVESDKKEKKELSKEEKEKEVKKEAGAKIMSDDKRKKKIEKGLKKRGKNKKK